MIACSQLFLQAHYVTNNIHATAIARTTSCGMECVGRITNKPFTKGCKQLNVGLSTGSCMEEEFPGGNAQRNISSLGPASRSLVHV